MSDRELYADNFGKLAKLYYDGNFGTASKSELDLLMFHFFYENECSKVKGKSGSLNKVSDYAIAVKLGITPQRVHALREKSELRYPRDDYDWKEEMKNLISEGKIVSDGVFICLSISNPRLYHEVEDFVEQKGGVVSYDNNSRVMKISPEIYVEVFKRCTNKTEKEIMNVLKKKLHENEELRKKLEKKGILPVLQENLGIGDIVSVFTSAGPLLYQVCQIVSSV